MRRFGIIGEHLLHTVSPAIYNTLFKRNNVEARYDVFEIPRHSFDAMIDDVTLELEGYNVTIPYKREMIKHVKSLSKGANEIGAINTVDSRKKGYNTDWMGFKESLNGIDFFEKNALVLGAGGAARAVCYALKEMGFKIHIENRTAKKSEMLAKEFGASTESPKLSKIALVVNTTPLGMYPYVNTMPNVILQKLPMQCVVYDLIYNPRPTLFLKEAKKIGMRTIDGLEMLIQQAVLNLEIWSFEKLAQQLKEAHDWVYKLV